jgi:hypothetical protein
MVEHRAEHRWAKYPVAQIHSYLLSSKGQGKLTHFLTTAIYVRISTRKFWLIKGRKNNAPEIVYAIFTRKPMHSVTH